MTTTKCHTYEIKLDFNRVDSLVKNGWLIRLILFASYGN